MTRIFTLIACLMLPLSAAAQDSLFSDYGAYESYVDTRIMNRDFLPLVMRLGGKNKYTEAEMTSVNVQLMAAMPRDFTDVAVLKRVDLGNGFSQEARVYWNSQLGYTYFFAFLHDTGDRMVVLRFDLNTSSKSIFANF